MIRWEHTWRSTWDADRGRQMDADGVIEMLDRAGLEGWEAWAFGQGGYFVYFKRVVREGNDAR